MPSLRFIFVLLAMIALTAAMVFWQCTTSQLGYFRTAPVTVDRTASPGPAGAVEPAGPPSAAGPGFAASALDGDGHDAP